MEIRAQDMRSSAYMEEFKRADKKRRASTKRNCVAVPAVKVPKTKIKLTTLELEKIALQKAKMFIIAKKAFVFVLIMVILSISGFAYMENSSYKSAVEVTIGDTMIGIVHSEKEFNQYLDEVKKELSALVNNEVVIDQKPSFVKKKVKEEYFTAPEQIEKRLKSIVDISVGAYAITVDGKQMGLVKDEAAAYSILEELKKPYTESGSNLKVGFDKDVKVEKKYVKVGEIQDREEVIKALTALEEEVKTYTVKEKDTLWDIALDHKIKIEEIIRMNPGITENIQPGQKINLSVPKPVLGIETRETVVYNEDIPFEIKEVKDPGLYEGRRTIIDKGINGRKKVEAEIIRINGIEVDKEIIKTVVLAEPKPQTEKVGTKPLPPKYGTGKFGRPLYGVITSRFGRRWGGMHHGIDIAGNVGDPIRASDGGKVIFAGWQGNYGYLVKINHDNEYTTYYAHCSKLLVKAGQRVAKGEIIAKVGNTGRSTGPHLHFEVRKNGVAKNPLYYLNQY